MFQPDEDGIFAVVAASGIRRTVACVIVYALGALVIYIAILPPFKVMLTPLLLVMGAAPIFAPLIGGQMLLFASWRAIFWAIAAFSSVCLLAVFFKLPETLEPEKRATHGLGEILKVYGRLFRHHQISTIRRQDHS